MGLDYSAGCVNFRDVGEYLSLLSDQIWLPPGRLLRGGKLDFVGSVQNVGSPGTIINLRAGPDRLNFPAHVIHRPAENSLEKYNTADRRVRRWLNEVVAVFVDETLPYPVLMHCTSGKDRTGIAVAALLLVLSVPEASIVEEYLLSDGEVNAEWIRQAITGMSRPETYFGRTNLDQIRRNIVGAK